MRGHYRNEIIVGTKPTMPALFAAPFAEPEWSWWKDWRTWAKIGVGVAVVGGVYYFVGRSMEHKMKEIHRLTKEFSKRR